MYQDYSRQLEALHELRSFLLQFQEELKQQTDRYKSRVESLREVGLPVQVLDNYLVNYYNPNHLTLHNLIDRVESVDLPFIQSNIAHTEQAIEVARRMGG